MFAFKRDIRKLDEAITGIIVSCIVGLCLSYYAYIVETSKEQDQDYEAMCDISEHISCTKVFMSKYGKGFGIIPEDSVFYMPNSVYGLGFYGLVFFLNLFNYYGITISGMSLVWLSNVGSLYLAWILYMLKDFCIICISTYIVNAILLVFFYRKSRILSRLKIKKH